MISINLYEIVMQIVNFLILLWVVSKYLLKPMTEMLDQRTKQISKDNDDAESNRRESEELISQQKQILNEARVEAKTIRKQAEDASLKERERVLSQVKQESEQLFSQTKKEIELNLVRVKKELITETSELAIMLSKKILKREVGSADRDNFVNDSLGKLQRA